jgi:fluoroacetyl-CoA thioesterase
MVNKLAVGMEAEKSVLITDDMGTGHTGTAVLSTPSMIGMIEQACLEVAAPCLAESEATVGIHVCVSHVAASVSGEVVTVRCQIVEIERRKMTFAVSASVGARLLGEGTHKRAIVDTRKFG